MDGYMQVNFVNLLLIRLEYLHVILKFLKVRAEGKASDSPKDVERMKIAPCFGKERFKLAEIKKARSYESTCDGCINGSV